MSISYNNEGNKSTHHISKVGCLVVWLGLGLVFGLASDGYESTIRMYNICCHSHFSEICL